MCVAHILQADPKAIKLPFGTRLAPLAEKTVHRTVFFNRSCLSEFDSLSNKKNETAKNAIPFFMVEPRRVELLSEKASDSGTPGAVCGLNFPLPKVHKQPSGFGSFIGHGSRKA